MDTPSQVNAEPRTPIFARTAFDQERFAATACEFLSRADLKGREAPVYGEVWNTLQAIGTGELLCADPQHQQDLHARDAELELACQQLADVRGELASLREYVLSLRVISADTVPVENLGATPVYPEERHHVEIELNDAAALDAVSMEPPALPA